MSARSDADRSGTLTAVGGPAGLVLALLGLAWLGATLATAHASVTGNAAQPDVALGAAAIALPNLVAAGLLAGATTGLAAASTPRAAARPVRRLVAGLASSAVVGAVCAGLIVFGYGTYPRVALLAATVAAGALAGGACAALPSPVLSAGLVATVVVLAIGLVAGFAQPGLVGLLGGGATIDSQVTAGFRVAYLVAAVAGLAAGLVAYRLLRRDDASTWAWPWYLLAGAVPGVLLLVTEMLTRTGGAGLLGAVRGLSEGDALAVDFNGFARLRNAMVVFFVGGLAAMIAVGRTLRPEPVDEPAASAAASAAASGPSTSDEDGGRGAWP